MKKTNTQKSRDIVLLSSCCIRTITCTLLFERLSHKRDWHRLDAEKIRDMTPRCLHHQEVIPHRLMIVQGAPQCTYASLGTVRSGYSLHDVCAPREFLYCQHSN